MACEALGTATSGPAAQALTLLGDMRLQLGQLTGATAALQHAVRAYVSGSGSSGDGGDSNGGGSGGGNGGATGGGASSVHSDAWMPSAGGPAARLCELAEGGVALHHRLGPGFGGFGGTHSVSPRSGSASPPTDGAPSADASARHSAEVSPYVSPVTAGALDAAAPFLLDESAVTSGGDAAVTARPAVAFAVSVLTADEQRAHARGQAGGAQAGDAQAGGQAGGVAASGSGGGASRLLPAPAADDIGCSTSCHLPASPSSTGSGVKAGDDTRVSVGGGGGGGRLPRPGDGLSVSLPELSAAPSDELADLDGEGRSPPSSPGRSRTARTSRSRWNFLKWHIFRERVSGGTGVGGAVHGGGGGHGGAVHALLTLGDVHFASATQAVQRGGPEDAIAVEEFAAAEESFNAALRAAKARSPPHSPGAVSRRLSREKAKGAAAGGGAGAGGEGGGGGGGKTAVAVGGASKEGRLPPSTPPPPPPPPPLPCPRRTCARRSGWPRWPSHAATRAGASPSSPSCLRQSRRCCSCVARRMRARAISTTRDASSLRRRGCGASAATACTSSRRCSSWSACVSTLRRSMWTLVD